MGIAGGPNMIEDGLVLILDASDRNSYVSGSTTWFDLSGNNYTGSFVSNPTFNTGSGGAISFNGSNLIYVPFIFDTSTNYTIEVVAKSNTMTSESANRQTIWSFNSGSGQGYQLLDLEIWGDGATSFNGNNNLYNTSINGAYSLVNSTNIKVYTLSKSGTTQSWYIDSIFKSNVNQQYSGLSQFFKLASRGGGATGGGQNWNGLIYSVKIYNRALSASEVIQNYNAIKSRFNL